MARGTLFILLVLGKTLLVLLKLLVEKRAIKLKFEAFAFLQNNRVVSYDFGCTESLDPSEGQNIRPSK